MIRLKSLITESYNIDFYEELRGHHHNQSDLKLIARDADTENKIELGYIDYSLYEEIVKVEYIKTHARFRGQGVGRALVNELIRLYGKDKINWGYRTGDGEEFFNALGIQQ